MEYVSVVYRDSSMHVRRTKDYLESELGLDRLLALTHGLASPGSRAFELILPVFSGVSRTQWAQLGSLGLRTDRMVEMAVSAAIALERLPLWAAPEIEQALQTTAAAFETTDSVLRSLLTILVIGELTPLPIVGVIEVMQRERALARLRSATRLFQNMQMVG